MKAVYKRRLLKAADIVEKVPRGEFDIHFFFTQCGSPGCVLGHYAVATKFRWIRGRIDKNGGGGYLDDPAADSMNHFGLSLKESVELFSTRGCGFAQTGKQAANYIRKFVERKYG